MSYTQCRAVQFYGGPLDGHVEVLFPPIDSLMIVKTIALSPQPPWFIRLLRVLLRHPKRKIVSIAVYQLHLHRQDLAYVYMRSGLTSDAANEAGFVQVVDDTIAFQPSPRLMKRHDQFTAHG
ncbi:MAG: hypothetical protein ACO1RT_14880 [Planctomycetaceae bacterium]